MRYEFNIREISNFTITDLSEIIDIEYEEGYYQYITNPIKSIQDDFEANKEDICYAMKILATWDKYPEIEIVDKLFDKAKYHLTTKSLYL